MTPTRHVLPVPQRRPGRRDIPAGGGGADRRRERAAARVWASRAARGRSSARDPAVPRSRAQSGWSPAYSGPWWRMRSAIRGSSRSTPIWCSTPGSFRSASASRTASSSAASPSRTWSRRRAGSRLRGLLPIVHSFACFLSTRAERADLQQRDRAHEGRLRRLARRAAAGRARPLAPVGARHRRAGRHPGPGDDRAVVRSRRRAGDGVLSRRNGNQLLPAAGLDPVPGPVSLPTTTGSSGAGASR